ncbi:hypothetical protein ACFV0G_03145, partial [Kitasatospora sp. NPDC059571]
MCHTAGSFGLPSDGNAPGRAFFAPGNFGDGSMSQNVDVSSAAPTIDGGGVHYNLAGWLGGWTTYGGYVAVGLHFRDGKGNPIGATAKLPTVSASDRGLSTEFLSRSTTGPGAGGARAMPVGGPVHDNTHHTRHRDNNT